MIHGYPPPAQIIGALTNAVFLDMFDYDAQNMNRLNRLIANLPPDKRHGLRETAVLILRPSEDLGRLASNYEFRLPGPFRFFTRGFGTRDTDSPDSLSLLMFEPHYLEYLIRLGESDAQARADEIVEFVQTGKEARG